MNTSSTYKKGQPQIALENILHFIKNNKLTISTLKDNPIYGPLNHDLNEALAGVIQTLLHEKSIHGLITSIALSYPSQYYYDLKEFDTFFEALSETILGLNSVITKTAKQTDSDGNEYIIDNRGRIRIDTYQDKAPETFVPTLRWYIRNNILKDLAKHHNVDMKRFESESTTSDDENEEINKIDSIKYNKHNIEMSSDFSNDICNRLTNESDIKLPLIKAIIARFAKRKPVAAFIYLSVINYSYDTMTTLRLLRTTNDFNSLFHTLLNLLEQTYNIDLSCFDEYIFRADDYLLSLRSIDEKKARARIDRLKSTTCSDVEKLPAYKVLESKSIAERKIIL